MICSAWRDQRVMLLFVMLIMQRVSLNLYCAIHGAHWIVSWVSLGKLCFVRGGKMYFSIGVKDSLVARCLLGFLIAVIVLLLCA